MEDPGHRGAGAQTAASGTPRPNFAHWAIAFFLGVIAACLLFRTDSLLDSMALAQPSSLAGARGVFAFTGQLNPDRYGVFMVDVDQGTIWCYEVSEKKLRLVAARSWRYDRYLEDHNAGDPTAREVEGMLDQQRRMRSPAPANPSPAASPDPANPAAGAPSAASGGQAVPPSNPDNPPEGP